MIYDKTEDNIYIYIYQHGCTSVKCEADHVSISGLSNYGETLRVTKLASEHQVPSIWIQLF